MIAIHIFNCGYGESIVVGLPNGNWGIVDSYSKSRELNPAIAFLERRGVKELKFLCLTHPHKDHYSGMLSIIDYFDRIEQFWAPISPTQNQLSAKLTTYIQEVEVGSDGEFEDIQNRIRSREDEISVKEVRPGLLLLDEDGVTIDGIAPHQRIVSRYQKPIDRWIDRVMAGAKPAKIPNLRHNDISVALMITYQGKKFLLCGDVENHTWIELINDKTCYVDLGPCHFLKVPHHGSENSVCQEFLRAVKNESRIRTAVVTPSYVHRLPKLSVVNSLKSICNEVKATHPPAPIRPGECFKDIATNVAASRTFKNVRLLPDEGRFGRVSVVFDNGQWICEKTRSASLL